MTAALIDDLKSLGLGKNEIAVYLALQRTGKVKAGSLIKTTGLHRNLVYQALEALGKRRLVTKSTSGTAAFFEATDPIHLLDTLREQELVAERLIDELRKQQKQSEQKITIYEGAEGIRAFNLRNATSLKNGQFIYVIGTGGARLEQVMGNTAIKKYFRLIEKNGGIKVLAYPSQQYTESMYALIRSKPMFHFRLLPDDLMPSAGVIFTDEHVGFIIYEGSPVVIEIKNAHLVTAYKNYFALLWNRAEALSGDK